MPAVDAIAIVIEMSDHVMFRTDQFFVSCEMMVDALDPEARAAFWAFAIWRGGAAHRIGLSDGRWHWRMGCPPTTLIFS